MQLPVLAFFYNWNNKLDCKAFTTIRMHNAGKYHAGAQFDVQLNKAIKGTATVVAVKSFLLSQLNEYMSYIDTGYSVTKCREVIQTMYKNKPVNFDTQLFDFVLLSYLPKQEATKTVTN